MTKYDAVIRYVAERIENGTWRAGDKLPSEEELVQTLGVSRNPVRQALAKLAAEGWIFKLRGSGSYVRQPKANDNIDIYALLYTENRRFETEIIHGMTLAVRNHPSRNLNLILKKPGEDTQELIEVLHSVDQTTRGGLVFLPVLNSERSLNRTLGATLRKLERPDFVVVQLDRSVPEYNGNLVMTDHLKGAYEMTDLLIHSGHRNIAILYEHPENTSIGLRFEGVKQRLSEEGIELKRDWQIHLPFAEAPERGPAIVDRLQRRGITSLFCFENAIALEILRSCRARGIDIPGELSLCTFDDHSFVGAERDFITCAEQQLENIGYFAVDIILKNLETPATTKSKLLLDPNLVVRQSVCEVKNERHQQSRNSLR